MTEKLTTEELSRRVPMAHIIPGGMFAGEIVCYGAGYCTTGRVDPEKELRAWKAGFVVAPWSPYMGPQAADYDHIPPLPEQCPPEIRERGYRTPEDAWQWDGTPWTAEPDPWAVPPEVARLFYADPRSNGLRIALHSKVVSGERRYVAYRPGSGLRSGYGSVLGFPSLCILAYQGWPSDFVLEDQVLAPEPADFRAAPEQAAAGTPEFAPRNDGDVEQRRPFTGEFLPTDEGPPLKPDSPRDASQVEAADTSPVPVRRQQQGSAPRHYAGIGSFHIEGDFPIDIGVGELLSAVLQLYAELTGGPPLPDPVQFAICDARKVAQRVLEWRLACADRYRNG